MNRERGNGIIMAIIGIVCILFVIGFFRSEHSFWGAVSFKQILRLPCGLTIEHPTQNPPDRISFPLTVDGYINGCGWIPAKSLAGTAQVFDGKGLPVTAPIPLIIPSDSTDQPYFFSATLLPTAAPSTDTGNVLIKSTTGLLYAKQVSF